MPKAASRLESALEALMATPIPRSQREWRALSTALRTVRRETAATNRFLTARREINSHRYFYVDYAGIPARTYNEVGSPIASIAMIGFQRRQHVQYGESRLADARSFANAARERGPVNLPDLRQTLLPDLQFQNLGCFATCMPMTDEGADWLAENLGDDAIMYGGAICIDFRCLEDIVLGARADGLVCHG